VKIELYKGDCLEIMDRLIEQGVKVDAIITDPPYGTTDCKWDSVIPFDELTPKMYKMLNPNGSILLFASGLFVPRVILSDIDNYKYKMVWVKNRPGNFFHAKNRPLTQHEDILVFSKAPMGHKSLLGDKRMTYNPQGLVEVNKVQKQGENKHRGITGKRPSHKETFVQTHTGYRSDVLHYNKDTGNFHPTQKPVALLEFLVRSYTNEGETVLDFAMGSGSTGVACVNTGRNFIGIELDDKYFEIASNRIEEARQQRFHNLEQV